MKNTSDDQETRPCRFRVVTFNVGLLEIFGAYRPVPFVNERFKCLPEALKKWGADVIALQEIYSTSRKEMLFQSVRDIYAFCSPLKIGATFGLESSLMILSKHPMQCEWEPFRSGMPDEKLFDNKGILTARLNCGDAIDVTVLNSHTTAGGVFSHPESPRTERIRSDQVTQILRKTSRESGQTVVICVDLNAGPEVSRMNYDQFIESGFVDLHGLVHGSNAAVTWDPLNTLNRSGPHSTSPPQRVDHIFVRGADLSTGRVQPQGSSIDAKEQCVATNKTHVTLSDHFAVEADLDIHPESG
jgi:endonuclease/exonuclease/phosphatase family metal-dependent hydrolase